VAVLRDGALRAKALERAGPGGSARRLGLLCRHDGKSSGSPPPGGGISRTGGSGDFVMKSTSRRLVWIAEPGASAYVRHPWLSDERDALPSVLGLQRRASLRSPFPG